MDDLIEKVDRMMAANRQAGFSRRLTAQCAVNLVLDALKTPSDEDISWAIDVANAKAAGVRESRFSDFFDAMLERARKEVLGDD